MIETIRCEPWYFIVNDEPEVNKWLIGFLPKLRQKLQAEREVVYE